tara:strand:+ start:1125 stop:2195 length:1071 start_codon:yes stop_codon:yes gene_type:complete
MSAFSTPRVAAPRSPSAELFADGIRKVNGEVIFDVETHAKLLSGSNKTEHYDTWELWGPAGEGLDSPNRQLQHLERVFQRQVGLGVPRLAPTIALDSPGSMEAGYALQTAAVARGLFGEAWQSIVGNRTFWRSGFLLDEHIGKLVALESPVWVVTVSNDMVMGPAPDLADTEAFSGLLRSVHSLSERSRVILTRSDFSGLLGVAAGADSIGAGWDRAMRTFDPLSYHRASDAGIRIPASYVTQDALLAVLRRDTADAIERLDPTLATSLRGGGMPPSEGAEREHHLASLSRRLNSLSGLSARADRIQMLRDSYSAAAHAFDDLIARIPGSVKAADKTTWNGQQSAVLESYATAEGL